MRFKNIKLMLLAISFLGLTPYVQANSQDCASQSNQRSYLDPTHLEIETGLDDGEVSFNLYADEIKSYIYNPSTNECDSVELRGYRSKESDPNAPYVAPTIQMVPGQTARVTLYN
ncbi:MAG: FtsP/CotA-like multicopper oxidase with cupredoxin domain, partial [Paraglaciecola sp.]